MGGQGIDGCSFLKKIFNSSILLWFWKAFESIRAVKRDEPSVGDTTRIQFRLPGKKTHFSSLANPASPINPINIPDGSRLVRKFLKSDPVLYLFQFIKASGVEGAATKRFDVNEKK